jgi:hypothetical protein
LDFKINDNHGLPLPTDDLAAVTTMTQFASVLNIKTGSFQSIQIKNSLTMTVNDDIGTNHRMTAVK